MVEKLNLDLSQLSGGGVCPAQFDGKTHDGREVYCRYRGGWLSVTIANVVGADCLSDGNDVLAIQLGPPLHGGLTLGQLCHYAGITINGQMPSLPTPEEMNSHSAKDLGGDWSYFNFWVNSTIATQRSFLECVLGAFDDCRIVQPVFTENYNLSGWEECRSADDLKSDFFSVVRANDRSLNLPPDAGGKKTLTQLLPEAFVIDVHTSGFKYKLGKYANDDATWVEKLCGRKIKVAGQCDEMLHGSFSVNACWKNDDKETYRFLLGLDALIDEVYPAYQLAAVDLATGANFDDKEYVAHYDPAVAEWMEGDDSRWLSVLRLGGRENPRAVGRRLVAIGNRSLKI
ncbi:MAG: hypothetical protein K0U74_15300 [Alphaproteobacteria bacterium]|nr:hypothetical protein [Alphaproteobacteria bacterium]